jgi:hypothetical protein
VIYVSAAQMRQMFNDGGYEERLHRGELTERVHPGGDAPANPKLGFPPGTRSQIVSYVDPSGTVVAIVHQYRRRDWTLAGSGKPDPKYLLENGQRYAVDSRSPRRRRRGSRRTPR